VLANETLHEETMAVYAVFEPALRKNETQVAPERFRFVRDGFSWGAFLFGPLWMLWRRLWLALVIYAVLTAALLAGLWAINASAGVLIVVAFLWALLLGFEGASVRRWTLARRGWIERGVVVGRGRLAAEASFFDRWGAEQAAQRMWTARPPMLRVTTPQPDVVGLFPEPGAGR
jgi:Protein of unknown function (DUF2628)